MSIAATMLYGYTIAAVKAITVTLLVPVFGMLWGVLLLGESLTAGRLAGCAIILAGCSLILGLVPNMRRATVVQ